MARQGGAPAQELQLAGAGDGDGDGGDLYRGTRRRATGIHGSPALKGVGDGMPGASSTRKIEKGPEETATPPMAS